jgi:antitoxin (DNA-binding transcriptional repressor) of toxin-antitoxin stability system
MDLPSGPLPPGSPQQVSKSRFKAKALELFRQVTTSGEPLVVTDHGRPTLEVRPYRPARPGPTPTPWRSCVARCCASTTRSRPSARTTGKPWRDPA